MMNENGGENFDLEHLIVIQSAALYSTHIGSMPTSYKWGNIKYKICIKSDQCHSPVFNIKVSFVEITLTKNIASHFKEHYLLLVMPIYSYL